MKQHQGGYIALISAIVIALLLLSLALGIGFSSIFGRLNILDSESKERSLALAQACVNIAILDLATGTTHANPVAVASATCKILSYNPTIKTQACVNRSTTNLQVTVDENFAITSLQELPNFSPNIPCP